MAKLSKSFYLEEDVTSISRQLLGNRICSTVDGQYCAAIITETEAYAGIDDKASHAYGGRRTKRTETMYAEGGVAYVYLCYGIHFLFNVVTNQRDTPHAVLIRAVKADAGHDLILKRRKKSHFSSDTLNGPGKLSQALGINLQHDGIDLLSNEIWIEESDLQINEENILIDKRVGIDYAEEDAERPYRFYIKI